MRTKIVTLCGSSRFMEEHLRVQKELTLQGVIVIPMGMFGHREPDFDMTGPIKKRLDELHLQKISVSDGIFVVNPLAQKCPRCETVWKKDLQANVTCLIKTCSCGEDLSEVPQLPYVGESTEREIAYAHLHHKKVEYLFPPRNVEEVSESKVVGDSEKVLAGEG